MSKKKDKQDNNGFLLIGLVIWGFFGFIFANVSIPGLILGVVFYWLVFSCFLKKRLTFNQYRLVLLGLFLLALADVLFFSDFLPMQEQTHKSYFGWTARKESFYNVYALFVQFWYGAVTFKDYIQIFVLPLVNILIGVCGWIGIFMLLVSKETAQGKLWRQWGEKQAHKAKHADFSKVNKIPFTNDDGIILGADLWEKSGKEIVYIPYEALNKHTCLVGTIGSGKTTTLLRFIESAIARGKALVLVDGKGDLGLMEGFKKLCAKYGRQPKIITMDSKDLGYNPFKVGTPTELTDKIINLFDWSEEHYKLGATRFIQLLIQYMHLEKIPVSLGNIVTYADTKILTSYHIQAGQQAIPPAPAESANADPLAILNFDSLEIEEIATEPTRPMQSESDILFEKIRGIEEKTKSGIRDRLATLAEGDMQHLFTNPHSLNLSEEIENGGCVLFSIDSLRYPLQSKGVGRLVVNDLKSCIPLHAKNGCKPVGVYFDEFNVFASHEVIDVINKSRYAGFEAVLSFQSLSDIDKLDSGEALRRQIIQNCNTLIVQKQNDSKDAEELSALFGTYENIELTVQEEIDTAFAGAGSARMVHEFKVHPDDIKNLETGEAFIKGAERLIKTNKNYRTTAKIVTKVKIAYNE